MEHNLWNVIAAMATILASFALSLPCIFVDDEGERVMCLPFIIGYFFKLIMTVIETFTLPIQQYCDYSLEYIFVIASYFLVGSAGEKFVKSKAVKY